MEKLRCTSQMSQNKKFKNENFKKENCSKTFRGHFENMSNPNGENTMLHIYTDIDCVISLYLDASENDVYCFPRISLHLHK